MSKDRRTFIKQVGLVTLGTMVMPSILPNLSFPNATPTFLNLNTLLQQASQARKAGQIQSALTLYNQIILSHPQEVRAYDGKRLTLAKLKYTEQEIFQMYQQAFESFPNHADFKARYANECLRLATGNNKFSNLINNRAQLLQSARQLFNQLRQAYPARLQYDELFKKARRKQNQNAITVDARINTDIKAYKKAERRKFKRRFNQNTITDLESRLQIILQKPQTPARKNRVRELYLRIVRKHRKDKNFPQLFDKLTEFYLWDKNDANTLSFIQKIAKRRKNFAFLENIERQNHTEKNTLWSAIALSETIIKRHRHEQVGNLNEVSPSV